MGNEPILDGDTVLGYVTSSDYGYSVGTGIAYGYLPTIHVRVGTGLKIEYLGKRYPERLHPDSCYTLDRLVGCLFLTFLLDFVLNLVRYVLQPKKRQELCLDLILRQCLWECRPDILRNVLVHS
jgi:hypothetical protein